MMADSPAEIVAFLESLTMDEIARAIDPAPFLTLEKGVLGWGAYYEDRGAYRNAPRRIKKAKKQAEAVLAMLRGLPK